MSESEPDGNADDASSGGGGGAGEDWFEAECEFEFDMDEESGGGDADPDLEFVFANEAVVECGGGESEDPRSDVGFCAFAFSLSRCLCLLFPFFPPTLLPALFRFCNGTPTTFANTSPSPPAFPPNPPCSASSLLSFSPSLSNLPLLRPISLSHSNGNSPTRRLTRLGSRRGMPSPLPLPLPSSRFCRMLSKNGLNAMCYLSRSHPSFGCGVAGK